MGHGADRPEMRMTVRREEQHRTLQPQECGTHPNPSRLRVICRGWGSAVRGYCDPLTGMITGFDSLNVS